MSEKVVVEQTSLTAAQMSEFWRQVAAGTITREMFQSFLEHRNPLGLGTAEDQLKVWTAFYQEYFGLTCDFSQVRIPKPKPGFDRLLVLAKGLTLNQVYDVLAKQFPCWRYENDLDKTVPTNDRDPKNGAYAIWVRDRQEADEELKNLSADQLKSQGIPGITLLERMLYELKHWDETQKHLDIQNWTLCSGSRDSDGSVPDAGWSVGRFRVGWSDSCSHYDALRARVAVPCLP